MDMMLLAVELEAQVMVGGNDVRHGLVRVIGTRQFEALHNDCLGMVALVASIESIVLRHDSVLNIDIQEQLFGLVHDPSYPVLYQGLARHKAP